MYCIAHIIGHQLRGVHQARAHGAIKVGHLDETTLLMEGGADVNNAIEADGMTPLMTAAL